MNSRRSWLVFGVSVFAYLIAVMQRSSLGIAGVDATERFDVQAAALSSLAVVQLIVYAGLQIPVGVVLDRHGPRVLIATGAVLMVAGQVTLALAPSIGVAIIGRILVGAGDAMTFISVSRLIASWFSGRALPLLSQAMGTTGALGQVLSAIPLSIVLHQFGWEPAYLSAAALSVLAFVLVILFVRNAPAGTVPVERPGGWPAALHQLRESLGRPGTQLGFWSHFVTQSPGAVLTLLWGFPFISVGLGYGATTASLFLTLIVAVGVVAGPLLGILSARYPYRRSNIVLGIVSAMGIAWAAVLLWPGEPPVWLVVLLLVVVAIGGPGSLIGFDFARTFNPARSLGSASGIVNVGGFLASFVMMLLIGVVLDVIDRANGGTGAPSELYSLEAFRVAFLVQIPVVGLGVVFLLLARRKTRRRLHEEEGIRVAPLWVALVRGWRRRGNRT
ncbi:MFS transporter [Conyzicola nivalis]|uniref:MFS transporter n=1 Tax=Conyzicola nivalis TaxID=1477021 RepID=A0A916SFT5_9MICO|nr:MFS transporter [Conyzicola nivalis]GGA97055.1 MFS transporter [Conyzicola nivalis]